MSSFPREELEFLLTPVEGPCLSLFLPTVRAGAETQQNPIRFKNLLREAERRLADRGLDGAVVEEMLAPLSRLLGDVPFWQHQEDGLAVFRSPEVFRHYRLRLALKELVAIEDRFHLKPILALLGGDERFFILALSMNQVRLLEASRHDARELELAGLPKSLTDALGEEVTEKELQYHSSGAARGPIYHGGEDDPKADIRRFFQRVDRGVREALNGHGAPLVLAGVEYLLPIYREVNGYGRLLDEGLTGSPDAVSPDDLRRKAWPLVEPIFQTARQEAAERFRALLGTGRASHQLDEVVPAAHDGRVDTLFVARGVRRWGFYDPRMRRVQLAPDHRPGSEDLLDAVALRTYLTGGNVFVVEPEEVPDPTEPVAAVYRY